MQWPDAAGAFRATSVYVGHSISGQGLTVTDHTFFAGHALEILRTLKANTADCVITSPPYWMQRNYSGARPVSWRDGQAVLGEEPTPEEFIDHLVEVFLEVKRVLKPRGSVWLNIGDTYYTGSSPEESYAYRSNLRGGTNKEASVKWYAPPHPTIKRKSLCLIPQKLGVALQTSGWIIRRDIIYHKTNAKPNNARDRPGLDHEIILFMTKSQRYWYDATAYQEPAEEGWRPVRSVWSLPIAHPQNGRGKIARGVEHYARFPEELVKRCLLLACPPGGLVVDPFGGSGTVSAVAKRHSGVRRPLALQATSSGAQPLHLFR